MKKKPNKSRKERNVGAWLIRVPPREHEAFKKFCERNNITMNDMAKHLITQVAQGTAELPSP